MKKRIYLIVSVILFVLFIVFEVLGSFFQCFKGEQGIKTGWMIEHWTELKQIGVAFNTIAAYIFILLCVFLIVGLIVFLILRLIKR